MHASPEFLRASEATAKGNTEALAQQLAQHPTTLTDRDELGRTLLCLACRAATEDAAIPSKPGEPAQHQAVDMILQAGADPDAHDLDGWAPLHTAAVSGNLDLARRLLTAGASHTGHLMGAAGGSPLALALFYAKTAMAELLADPVEPDNLRSAAALGRDLDCFLQAGELTDQATTGLDFYRPSKLFPEWQRTCSRQEVIDEALTWSCRHPRIATMQRLLQLGADPNGNPYRGTPLTWAVYCDNVDTVRWLLDHGADPDLRHDFGGTEHGKQAVAMHLAAQYGGTKSLSLLLERGANPNIKDGGFDATPLGWAKHNQADESVRILIEAGASE